MKKVTFWSMLMLAVLALPMLMACGGDDDGGGGNGGSGTDIVDGVRVNTGKKLKELTITDITEGSYKEEHNITLKIDYDSKGRLSKVTYFDAIIEDVEVLSIDYDLRAIQINDYSGKLTNVFSVNKDGYISQIGNCSCTYDTNGYLIGTESSKEIINLAYNEGELIKSMVNNITRGYTKLYYIYSGEDITRGELVFTMSCPDNKKHLPSGIRPLLIFIGYQAGLFGKISKNCTALSKKSQGNVAFTKAYENSANNIVIRGSFKFQ